MNSDNPRSRPRKLKRISPGVQQALYPIDGHGLFKVTLTYRRGQPVLTIEPDAGESKVVDLVQS